jgi:hypothetical protein
MSWVEPRSCDCGRFNTRKCSRTSERAKRRRHTAPCRFDRTRRIAVFCAQCGGSSLDPTVNTSVLAKRRAINMVGSTYKSNHHSEGVANPNERRRTAVYVARHVENGWRPVYRQRGMASAFRPPIGETNRLVCLSTVCPRFLFATTRTCFPPAIEELKKFLTSRILRVLWRVTL